MVRKCSLSHTAKNRDLKKFLVDRSVRTSRSEQEMLTVAYDVLVFLFEFFKVWVYDGDVVLCNKNYENVPFQIVNAKVPERTIISYSVFTLQFL